MFACTETRAGKDWRRIIFLALVAGLVATMACSPVEPPASVAAVPGVEDAKQKAAKDPTDPDVFLATLPEVLVGYDETRLQQLVDDFNRRQQESFGQNAMDWAPPTVGYTQFAIADFGDYFVLDQKRVERAHSAGVDDGVDGHTAIFFAKASVREIVRREGPAYPFANRNLVLLAPATDSCMGDLVPGTAIAVFDLRLGKDVFRAELPPGTISLNGVGSHSVNAIHFTMVDETPIAGDGCEVGGRVLRRSSNVEVRCQPETGPCRMTRKIRSVVQDCESIGSCD